MVVTSFIDEQILFRNDESQIINTKCVIHDAKPEIIRQCFYVKLNHIYVCVYGRSNPVVISNLYTYFNLAVILNENMTDKKMAREGSPKNTSTNIWMRHTFEKFWTANFSRTDAGFWPKLRFYIRRTRLARRCNAEKFRIYCEFRDTLYWSIESD